MSRLRVSWGHGRAAYPQDPDWLAFRSLLVVRRVPCAATRPPAALVYIKQGCLGSHLAYVITDIFRR